MSRLVTARYEYAQYDDAQGVLSPAKDVPPTYPPTLDEYRYSSTASVAQSFGTQNVNATTGASTAVATPANATLNVFCPVSNTMLVGITVANATPTLNAAPTTLIFYAAPGQTVTIPGSINSGSVTVSAYNLSLAAVTTAFVANIMWSL